MSRLHRAGLAQRLAPGIYAVGATLPIEQVARHHLHAIVAHIFPGGVFCGVSALAGGFPTEGCIYVSHPNPSRTQKVSLPGLTIYPILGPGILPGDILLPQGIAISGQARTLVENMDTPGRRPRHRTGTPAVDDRIDEFDRTGGAGRIKTTLEQLDVIASSFDQNLVRPIRERLVALLGTHNNDITPPPSGALQARLDGNPYDSHRLTMIDSLVEMLAQSSPRPVHAIPPPSRWEWLAFFEAYFSNFIEGTEFGVDEAMRIAVEGVVPQARPADAHDVSSTYRLAVDDQNRTLVPSSGDDLIHILEDRHRILMAARQDKNPGVIKSVPNYAGGYEFVKPPLVRETLRRGFDSLNRLNDPLMRSVAMMALITECHPFDDGNGRVARLTANAELSKAGQVRIVIPTVYRDEYMRALTGLSGGAGHGESLLSVLEYAQRWTSAVDWSDYQEARDVLEECNAFRSTHTGDGKGNRLIFAAR